MTTQPFTITQQQRDLLDANPHHHAVSFLDDGDLLICEDAGPVFPGMPEKNLPLWAVWVLTRDGSVQSTTWHLDHYHDWRNEHPGRPTAEPPPAPTTKPPAIIDVMDAAQHLLLKYRVDVTGRTVRNWLKAGKLAGSQLGSADRSPWYTTRDAIDVAATRDWFPDPIPELPLDKQANETKGADPIRRHLLEEAMLQDESWEAPNVPD